MSTAAEKDTVWIGFMDIVPVIGTVKEAVELVLAVYEGNKSVIKEKEKALENIVKESLKKDVKRSTPPDKPAAAADQFSGLRNVREVRKETIIEYMMQASKSGPKPSTSAPKKEKEKRVEAIEKDMLEKIRIINPDFKEELEKQLKKSQKGEHVFNNNLLRFHSDVLKDFIKKKNIGNLEGYNQHQQAINELGRRTLSQNTADEIQKNMVVHFDQDEFYVNANGLEYGIYCRALRDALFDVLNHINPDDVPQEERQWVNSVIDNMINLQVYVDQLAKVKWIAKQTSTTQAQIRFDNVRGEVANMYKTGRGYDWCIRILRLVAPLFETMVPKLEGATPRGGTEL